ncbi:MAG TPA: plastocyanin/azurin family copper-binding protein, partial [Ilumatobacter sp.]|nr:plastocyanin/azurin family copper-binding protein [Ilumatobacter sp.]
HDAMVTDDHDAMTDDHDAMVTDDHEDVDAASSAGVVVNVEMIEFGFVADTPSIPVGQPVTFRFQNTGVVPHEAMFGSIHQQEEFAQQTDHGDGHGSASHHGDVAAITLDAGETGEITLEFASPGEIWMGCHLPGHYAAGMIATLAVV